MRDRPVRTVDPAARRHCDLVFLRQVDRDAIRVEEMCDALDRGLERVGERELRDRLADDGEERAAALELEPGVAGQFGRAQRMRGADGEARELLDHVLVRRSAGRKANLKRTERRLAELKRHDLCGRPTVDRDRVGLLDHGVCSPGERFVGHDRPIRAGDLERLVAQPPDDRSVTTGRNRREPRQPRRGGVLRGERGERIADDSEGAVASRSHRDAAVEPGCEPGELGRDRREPQLVRVERRTATRELDRPVPSGCVERDGQPLDAPVEPGPDDRRRALERLGAQPLDLRRQAGGRRRDRAGGEAAVSLGQPDHRHLRPGPASRRVSQVRESLLDRRTFGERAGGARQHRERLGDVGARPAADQSPKSRSTSRQIVNVSSTLIAIRPRRTSQKRNAARRLARERSIRARRRARSWR